MGSLAEIARQAYADERAEAERRQVERRERMERDAHNLVERTVDTLLRAYAPRPSDFPKPHLTSVHQSEDGTGYSAYFDLDGLLFVVKSNHHMRLWLADGTEVRGLAHLGQLLGEQDLS